MVLKRNIYPILDFVLSALENENLMEAYNSRPDYQKNDYIGWISKAKKPETQAKRLNQMLSELKSGYKYMGMEYRVK